MRHLILAIVSSLMVLMTGCTSSFLPKPELEKGEVLISLSQDDAENEVETKAGPALPDVGEFEVEIYDLYGNRRYRDLYKNSTGRKISLNAGTHRLLCQYGDSTGVGFNSFYYAADQNFEVQGQTLTEIQAVAKMTKVKVSVEFGESITGAYGDWYAKVKTEDGRSLKFSKTESRSGYFPEGNLILEVYVQENGQWKYFACEPEMARANDFVHFTVNTTDSKGTFTVSVVLDNGTEVIEKTFEIPGLLAPQAAPEITVKGDGTKDFRFYEAEDFSTTTLQADIKALSGVRNCVLQFNSSVLPGVPAGQYDLAALTPDQDAALKAIGLKWLRDMKDKRLSYVDFSGLLTYISTNVHYVPGQETVADLQLNVTDAEGQQASSQSYTFGLLPAEITLNFTEGDVWAHELAKVQAQVTAGHPEQFQLQVRKTGQGEFRNIGQHQLTDGALSFTAVNGLEAGVEYEMRAIYHNNPENVSAVHKFTTEQELQIGNADFEDWTEQTFNFKVTLGGKASQVWFQPWTAGSEAWWAVNSRKTMIAECTAGFLTYKVFPTVSYTTGFSGNAAQVSTASSGAWASPGLAAKVVYAGQIWIGTDDGDGNLKSAGHAFASRPKKVSFWKKNQPINNEATRVLLELKAADGTVIAKAVSEDASIDTAGKEVVLDLQYSDLTKKAATIEMSILSSTAAKPTYKDMAITMAGKEYNSNLGSRITVDHIRLIY